MAVQLIPTGDLFLGDFFLHESPLWLICKRCHAEACQALEALGGLPVEHQYVQQEVCIIQNRLNEEA